MGNGVSWHDVRDMTPPELADFMVSVCDPSFAKHHKAILDHAVGGGILCGLGEKPLRDFLTDISITLKPQQDFIVQALEELRRSTELAVAALEESGSPFKHTVVRNLRTHHAAYVTFTKEGDTFRGATKFAKSLRRTIDSAWDPPTVPVTVRLRGSGTLGVTSGPLLHEVAQSLNVVWLVSNGSLEDPLCLMEVCTAVRQGTPVLPVRLAGVGMKPLNLPIWGYSIAAKPSRSTAGAAVSLPNAATDGGRDAAGGKNEPASGRCNEDIRTAIETGERARRLRRRAVDGFYAQLAQRLPKHVQVELHRNNFLVKDVVAAVRACFESAEEAPGGTGHAPAAATSDKPVVANPPIFDPSAQPAHHEKLLNALVGANRQRTGEEGAASVASQEERKELSSLWNWEQIPRNAPLAGRARVNDAVPWRTEEETLEMIRMENAEADDLAGLLVRDMLTHPGSENHQWEGCKGLADLAARDSDGLSAVRRQGGIQAILAALAACPKDADVQRWGCQGLLPLFGDAVVAARFREAGVAAVIRALAVLQDVETALKSMGAGAAPAMTSSGGGGGGSGRPKAKLTREKWARAMKKIEVGRVKEQRRVSLEKKDAVVQMLEKQEAHLAQRIEARRKSLELELQQEIERGDAVELAATHESTTTAPNASGSSAEHVSSEEKETENDGASVCKIEKGDNEREDDETKNEIGGGDDEGGNDSDGLNALAEEQRRLEEQDKLEHAAEMARLKKIQEENKPDPWAMTDADVAVYDKAFIEQDKDKDGFITLREAKSMFDKAGASKEARRHIWGLADPYQRGKLTQHGWRVAYHLARSTKKRKLELPETLPRCLYPPGYAPVAESPVGGNNDADGVTEVPNRQRTIAVGDESEKGGKSLVGGGATVKGGKVAGGKGNGQGKGKGKGNGKGEGEKKKDGKVGHATASAIDASKSPKKKNGKGGDKKKVLAAEKKKKRRSVEGKNAVSTPKAPSEELNDRDKNVRYRMSNAQQAKYNEMFDKLTKRKSVQAIDRAKAAAILAKSGLSNADVGRLWAMGDADRDGKLSRHEFAVIMHLAACAVEKDGLPLPATLPPCLAAATATVAATASDQGGEDEQGEMEGKAILLDDGTSVVSSLGYPEGLSDIEGSDEGDDVGTGDNTPRREKSPELSPEATSVVVKDKDSEEATAAKRKTNGNTEGEAAEGGEAGMEKENKGDLRYTMGAQDIVNYGKAFDKLVNKKSKGTNSLGGKEAAVILAKSGLGKEELGRLWALSDADRDGALSRMEFSVAMHLASCSAKKGLPVPSALPDSLAALLPRGPIKDGKLKPVAEVGKKNMRGKPNQKLEKPVAHSPDEEHSGSGHAHGAIVAKGKYAGKAERGGAGHAADQKSSAAVRTKAGGQAAGEGDRQAGAGSRTNKSGRKKAAAGKVGQKKVPENARDGTGEDKTGKRSKKTAEKENRASKERGFVFFASSPADTTVEAKKHPSAENESLASESSAPAAHDHGGQKKKRPRKEIEGGKRETLQEGKEEVAVATGKRGSSPGNKNRAGSKALTAKSSTAEKKEDNSAATAGAAAAGGGVGGVVAGSATTKSPAQGIHGDHGPGEYRSSSIVQAQSAEVGGGDNEQSSGAPEGNTEKKVTMGKKHISREERDELYAMSTSERASYDVVFMQIDADHGGTIDGREAAQLLGKSGLSREQLKVVWGLADKDDKGELDHDEWAIAMHLSRCVAQKNLPLPDVLPKSLGGPDLPDGEGQGQPKGSKARREAQQAREEEKKALAKRAVKLREHTQAFRLGEVTAAAFYIKLAEAFGSKRHTMIPKVARTLPLDKARALLAAAGLGENVLEDDEATEQQLKQLRRRRVDQVNLHVKSTTSGATARDVQLLACRLANRLCSTLDDEANGGRVGGGGKVGAASGGGGLGNKTTVAARMASAGCVEAVAQIFRMFEALDLELMVETLQLSLVLARACAVAPVIDASASESSSLASSSQEPAVAEESAEPSPLLPLLRPLYKPSTCRRIADVAKQFPRSRKSQRLCCLLVGELGSTCGAPARRCFADCCEPVVAAAAGSLDEHAASDSDGSSVHGGGGGGGGGGGNETPSLPKEGVREVACQALATLAKEPGLSRRLVAAGAGQAVTRAMEAAPRDYDVQLSSLETMAMLTEHNRDMWNDNGGDNDDSELPAAIDAPCRRAVHSVQTFVRDSDIHRAASRAILALLVSDAAESAARSVAAAGGATALSRVLATSPTNGEVQLPAVLAINELLERSSSSSSRSSSSSGESTETPTTKQGSGGEAPTTAVAAAGEIEPPAEAIQTVEREFVAAAGCELLCKSAKTFPRDRELRLGCLRAMAALCRGIPETAVDRLLDGGVCEQLMKIVGAYPGDTEARRAGLALLVGIAEYGDGTSGRSEDEEGGPDDSNGTPRTSSTAAGVVNRLGFVGAVAFAAAWLREATAPAWAWVGAGYGGGHGALDRAQDLLMSCKAAFFLTHHSSSNRERLASMGAIEALTRAVALSGRRSDVEDAAGRGSPTQADAKDGLLLQTADEWQDPVVPIQAETQVWAAQALAELAGGHENESRCSALVRCGSLRALFAAMNKSRSARELQRAGCIALGHVAGCLKVKDLQTLGRNGGAQAVTAAFKACPGDKDVALAGLLAVAELSISSENRRLLGEAGACPLISKELLEFSDDEIVAEEGCRAVTRVAALSGFNRTALGLAGAAEATATALLNHPSKSKVQRWGLSAAAALVAETDPSGNTDRITRAGILDLAVQALAKFRHNPTVQAEGLKIFAKVASSGEDGANAVWAARVVLPTTRALGLYLNDANVQHWGSSTVRVLTGSDDKCEAWRGAGAPEAVVRVLVAFSKDGSGRHARHDEEGLGRTSVTRRCTADESLCIQFQACAAALKLAASSPDARRRIVTEGAGEALAGMMKNNSSVAAAQQGALATLAVLSASGVENRKRLHRYKGGVPTAIVSALEAFPDDRRVRSEGVLTVQNLSLAAGGARAIIKAGIAPVIVRLLQALMKEDQRTLAPGTDEAVNGEHLDRNVLVYLLNGLSNMATANEDLSDFVGRHGACQAVVSVLEQRPRDLQLQAAGIKAVRALALGGGRNIEVLADVRGPMAVARAAGLFLRDREIQLACLAAAEVLCWGGNRANRDALARAGSVDLLENAVLLFASDAEVVSQGFRALVEMVLLGASVVGEPLDAGHAGGKQRRHRKKVDQSPLAGSFGLPRLSLTGEKTAAVPGPARPGEDSGGTGGGVDIADVSRAVETVLAALERNPCREVCLSAFDALNRLIVNLGAVESLGVETGSSSGDEQLDERRDIATRTPTKRAQDGVNGVDASCAGGKFQLAKVRYGVKRALKINGTSDSDLASRGGKILTLISVARGRALAQ